MNKTQILSLLDAGIKNNTLPPMDIDKETLLTLREQTFLAFPYRVYQDVRYKKYYLNVALAGESFTELGKKLEKTLNENQISHLFVKGYLLRDLYPDPYLRMLGDIDFYVQPKDIKRAKKALIDAGFVFENQCDHHLSFHYHGLSIEMHDHLVSQREIGYEFFEKPFEHAILIREFSYSLEDNYHLLFILLHYLHHMQKGAGLRELGDIYLFVKKKTVDLSWVYEQMKKLKMEKFFDTVFSEIEEIFHEKLGTYQKNPYVQEIIEFSLESGIHGNGSKGDAIKNQSSQYKNKFTYLCSRLFLPVSSMFSVYPWTKSIILLPCGYIYRFFYLLFSKNSRNKLRKTMKIEIDNDIFCKMGIINK